MAGPSSTHLRPSPLKQLVNFTSSTAGLEKALRLVQALIQVAAESGVDSINATRCLIARDQLALGRRYFRLLDFYAFFEHVHEILVGNSLSKGGLLTLMEVTESTFLGLYLLLENLTILHDMNVYLVSWYTPLLVEASKLWFYAIILSIARATWELFFSNTTVETKAGQNKEKPGSEKPPAETPSSSTAPLVKRIIVDSCDLLLPGSFIGWTPASDLWIGITMVVSTVITSEDLWKRARR